MKFAFDIAYKSILAIYIYLYIICSMLNKIKELNNMKTELTDKNKKELIEKGGTCFDLATTEEEYKILCQKANTFLATHNVNQFIKEQD